MPIISTTADFLGLSLYDPQSEEIYEPGTPPDVLIQSWVKHNERATRALAKDKNEPIRKPYLHPERSRYWWQYTRDRESYQSRLGDDVFVPSILPMVDSADRVKLVVIWSAETQGRGIFSKLAPLPQVFPVCDFLLLVWGESSTGPLCKALVPYSLATSLMVELLDDMEGPVDGLRVLKPAKQSPASSLYKRLSRAEFRDLRQIAPDGFVDVTVE